MFIKNLKLFENYSFIISTKFKIIFFIIALVVNIFWLYASKITHNPNGSEIYISGIELQKDLNASENFIKTGNYYFGKNNLGEDDYTYRLPGFLFVYLPFRLFFGIHGALTAIVILQVLLSALASLVLSRIVYNLTKNPIYYYLSFFLFLGGAYVQQYNFGLNRESLATYVLIFALYFLQKWNSNKKFSLLIIFSLLLTWCFLYRAFLAPPIFLIFAIILFYQWNKNNKLPIKIAIIIFLPSFIFFSYWIPRNYILTGKFIPHETCASVSLKSANGVSQLIKTWGGNIFSWVENSEASWFEKPDSTTEKEVSDNIMPSFLFNDKLILDTLKKARACYRIAINTAIPIKERFYYDEKGAEIFNRFILYQKQKFPLRTYITSKFIYLFNFLNQPIGLRTMNLRYPLNVLFTFITSFINYLIFFGGFLISIILLFMKKSYKYLFFGQIIVFFLIVFFVGFFTIEQRRIAHIYPFLLINILFLMKFIFEKQKKIGWAILLLVVPIITVFAVNSCINSIVW